MQDLLMDDGLIEKEPSKPTKLYPHLTKRCAAWWLDVGLVYLMVIGLFSLKQYANLNVSFYYLLLLFVPVYKWWLEGKVGATLGKRILGIVVVQEGTHQAIGLLDSFKRNWLLFPIFIVFTGMLCLHHLFALMELDYMHYIQQVERLRMLLFFLWGMYIVGNFVLLFTFPRSFFDSMAKTVCVHKKALDQEQSITP